MMFKPILCRDGTIISVQASSMHYCSPRNDFAKCYSAVEIMVEDGTPECYNSLDKVQAFITPQVLMELIANHGGVVAGELPPLNFGNHMMVDERNKDIAWLGNAWQYEQEQKQTKGSEEE